MQELQVLRIDDIVLLYGQVMELGLQEIIDKKIRTHGNWSGLSLGHLVSIWLCYLLSRSDHRLDSVEAWAEENIALLKTLSGQYELRCKDFTDDRLEQALDYISKASNWLEVSNELNRRSLEIYDMDKLKTVRLDAAPMQGHHGVNGAGLFQYGYSKHHDSRLGMLKIMLACIDNEVNGFSYPLAHLTVSGEKADDGLYIPLIAQCEQTFSLIGEQGKKLYVADAKMGSKENRCYIVGTGNDYLVPLSKVQLSSRQRNEAIAQADKAAYKQVYKEDKLGKKILVAQGFEQIVKLDYVDSKGELQEWIERRIFVLSTAYSTSQKKGVDKQLIQAEDALKALTVGKQGKKIPKTRADLDLAIQQILSSKGLEELLEVSIEEQIHEKNIRAYKNRPARIEQYTTFDLRISRKQQAIQAHKATLGWQVYATTVGEQKLDFEKCVWKYRYQNRVERRFDDLRNKVVPLLPIFVKKDNRVEALINLLMICLKICTLMEYKVAKQLQAQEQELDNIYEGNPKRATPNPTAKRMLNSFKGISLVLIPNQHQAIPDIRMTPLKDVQFKIIDLLGFNNTIYTGLVEKMKIFFSTKKISEI